MKKICKVLFLTGAVLSASSTFAVNIINPVPPQSLSHPVSPSSPGSSKSPMTEKQKQKILADAQNHYYEGLKALHLENWDVAVQEFSLVTTAATESPLASDAYFYSGVCYYELEEHQMANEAFNSYLKLKNDPQYFEEALKYKFSIAEKFRCGSKRRPFNYKPLPKWLSATNEALLIYDEVVAALPTHDLAAQALFYKGCLLWKNQEFREAVDSFNMLIRRFPKNELTPQAYLNITKVYLDQCQYEFQNPDIIALAEVNVNKFSREFPRDERAALAGNDLLRIKEVYASGLYETGRYYERKEKPRASLIYYEKAILNFPETNVAQWCRNRLEKVAPKFLAGLEERMAEQVSKIENFNNLENFDFNLEEFEKDMFDNN